MATLPEDLLRAFAVDVLGAKRCSVGYLLALRCILGNQAKADDNGAELEMNHRVSFATGRTMRTLIGQFNQAGITYQRSKVNSVEHSQVVTCYRKSIFSNMAPEEEYCKRQRDSEERAFQKYLQSRGITEADIPY